MRICLKKNGKTRFASIPKELMPILKEYGLQRKEISTRYSIIPVKKHRQRDEEIHLFEQRKEDDYTCYQISLEPIQHQNILDWYESKFS